MNLPNKLTIARLCSLPVLMLCFSLNSTLARWGVFVIFVVASLTDFLDGRIARSQNLVTNLGKFLDPLADKALVCTILVYFVALGYAHPVTVIIVLAREFVVSGVRMAAVTEGKVIAANIYGKIKTAFQMVSIAVILCLRALNPGFSWPLSVANICCWIIAVLTAASGVVYVVDNIDVFKEKG